MKKTARRSQQLQGRRIQCLAVTVTRRNSPTYLFSSFDLQPSFQITRIQTRTILVDPTHL